MKYVKKFTPLRCKCCGKIIEEDIHDSFCLDCLSEITKLMEEEAEIERNHYGKTGRKQ